MTKRGEPGYDAQKCFETLPCRAEMSRDNTKFASVQRVAKVAVRHRS